MPPFCREVLKFWELLHSASFFFPVLQTTERPRGPRGGERELGCIILQIVLSQF